MACDVLAVAWIIPRLNHTQHVLRGSGLVLSVVRIYVGAVFQKELRDLNRRCEMQRRLAVSAADADNSGIRSHKFPQLLQVPEACGRVRIQIGRASCRETV